MKCHHPISTSGFQSLAEVLHTLEALGEHSQVQMPIHPLIPVSSDREAHCSSLLSVAVVKHCPEAT